MESYVDDFRVMGTGKVRRKNATSRVSQIFQYLGQQDTARKYRPPHIIPGPWCGCFIAIKDGCIWVYVSLEKWEKAKAFIEELEH